MRNLQGQTTAYSDTRRGRNPEYVGMVSGKPKAHLELMFARDDKDNKKRFYRYIKLGKKTQTCFYTDQKIYQQWIQRGSPHYAFFASVFPDKVSQASMISKRTQRGEQLLAAGED